MSIETHHLAFATKQSYTVAATTFAASSSVSSLSRNDGIYTVTDSNIQTTDTSVQIISSYSSSLSRIDVLRSVSNESRRRWFTWWSFMKRELSCWQKVTIMYTTKYLLHHIFCFLVWNKICYQIIVILLHGLWSSWSQSISTWLSIWCY